MQNLLKLKEQLEIHGYCSYYYQPSSIWSDGNLFADKVIICALIGLTIVANVFVANWLNSF